MNNIVFDLILLEADRVINQKVKGLDLYYKNQKGEFVPIAEGYNAQADDVIDTLKNYSLRDIQQLTDMNMKFVMSSIKELCAKDIIRFTTEKNRRTYMVNPIYFYKGTIKKLFYCVKEFDRMPQRNEELDEQYSNND